MTLTFARTTESQSAEIVEKKAEAVAQVNKDIGQVRLKFITDIPGQEGIYKMQEEEARAFLVDTDDPIDMTNYPFISRQVGIIAPTAQGVAQVWANMAALWYSVGADLEALRQGTQMQIQGATTVSQIKAIMDGFKAILEEI